MKFSIHSLIFLFFFGSFSSCNVVGKVLKNYKENEEEVKEELAELTQTIIDEVKNDLNNDSIFINLRAELDALLDSAFVTANGGLDTLFNDVPDTLLGFSTDSLIKERLLTIRESLKVTLEELKGSMTDEQIPAFFKKLIKEQLQQDLSDLVKEIRADLLSEETAASLAVFRESIQGEVDVLLVSAITKAANQADSVLFPQIHSVLDRADAFKEDSKNILNNVLLGVAGLLLLATILYFWRQSVKRRQESLANEKEFKRHRQMVSILTRHIDKIESQRIYDNLVGGINKEMVTTGLEPRLKKVLEDEGLDKQPEWENKDNAVLKLLLEELNSADAEEKEKIFEKARGVNLEDHLRSITKENE